jgi:hypothetical protein
MGSYAEQRAHPRQDAQRRGVVVHGPTGRGFSCVIVDISAGGARLQLFDPTFPKDELTLIDAEVGEIHELRIAWRNDPFLGVAFTSSEALP